MNKKGLEDTLFTWIAAFFIILFVMLIYIVLVFAIFTGKELGRRPEVDFEGSNVDLVLNSKFLSFLGTKIFVNDIPAELFLLPIVKGALSVPTNNCGQHLLWQRSRHCCPLLSCYQPCL